jgi:hypothetical protein
MLSVIFIGNTTICYDCVALCYPLTKQLDAEKAAIAGITRDISVRQGAEVCLPFIFIFIFIFVCFTNLETAVISKLGIKLIFQSEQREKLAPLVAEEKSLRAQILV